MKLPLLLATSFLAATAAFSQVPSSWNVTGIGGGGALFAPTINPANNSEFYFSSDLSAMYHTTNNGQSYSILDGKQIQGFHNSAVRFTSTANLLYSVNYANNLIAPVKSTDGGITWSTLSGNPDASEETYSINVDYNNPNRIVLGYYGAIYFSNDGGNSFTNFHNAISNGAGCLVAGVFFDGNNIYIGSNDGLFVSANGGGSFAISSATGIPSNERIFSLAGAKVGNTTRLFCLTGDVNDTYNGEQGSDYYNYLRGIYSLDYGAGNWMQKMNGITSSSDFLMFLGMAENDISTCYAAGGSSSGNPDIMKTTDGGATWNHFFNTNNNQNIITGWCGSGGDKQWSWAESPFGFALAPNNANIAIMVDYNMDTRTDDGGTTWRQAYINTADEHAANAVTPTKRSYHSVGMENTACWQVFWNDQENLFSAYTDIFMIRSQDAGQSWSFNYSYTPSNTVYRIAKSASGNLYAATSTIHDMYKSYKLTDASIDNGGGKIIFSADGGATWSDLHDFTHPVYWVAADPTNANRMYASVVNYGASAGGIYICNDLNNGAASTWTKLNAPPRTEGHPASITVLNNGDVLCSFSGRRTSVFTASSGVFLLDHSTNTWSDRTDPMMDYYAKDVVVDPYDATQQTWYAGVFSGWSGPGNNDGGLYKTTNGGTTWTRIFSGADVPSCTFSPVNHDELYIATSGNGLWHCDNINAVTPTITQVSSYKFANPERIFFNPYNNEEVWIATFGYGMNIGETNVGIAEQNFPSEVTLFPNPASDQIKIEITNATNSDLQFHLLNSFGQIMMRKNFEIVSNHFSTSIDVSTLPSGIYLGEMICGKELLQKKFLIIR